MALPNTATASLVSHRVVVVVFPRVQSLDVVGAVEVFADANKQAEAHGLPFVYDIQVAAPVAGLVETSSGIPFLATASLEQITGPLDTLLIGSGRGAREAAANENSDSRRPPPRCFGESGGFGLHWRVSTRRHGALGRAPRGHPLGQMQGVLTKVPVSQG